MAERSATETTPYEDPITWIGIILLEHLITEIFDVSLKYSIALPQSTRDTLLVLIQASPDIARTCQELLVPLIMLFIT